MLSFCLLSITSLLAHISAWQNEMVPRYTDCLVVVFVVFLRLMLKEIVNAVCSKNQMTLYPILLRTAKSNLYIFVLFKDL